MVCFNTLPPGDLREYPENINGMVVAEWTAIAFWAWLTKGGRNDALDNFCNSLGSVVTRRGQ
jgi:hypothetical protein